MERELRTVNALSSHFAEMSKSAPFSEEYANASSSAERAAIVKKFSWLFSQSRTFSEIYLHFSNDASLSITADNKQINA